MTANTPPTPAASQRRPSRNFPLLAVCLSAFAAGVGMLVYAVDPAPDNANLFESSGTADPKLVVVELGFVPGRLPESKRLEVRDSLSILEGDIVIGTEADPSKGLTDAKIKLWKRAEIPYFLPANFPNRATVEKAIKSYHDNTKIKFVALQAPAGDCINFITTSNPNIGGQSHLGRKGGVQELWMNEDTSKWNIGTVIHELGHALGLMHEQCRNDRDKYVEIIRDNILKGYESQFALLNNGRDIRDYDFDSILHYPATAFARTPGLVTIKPRPEYKGKAFGQRQRLSKLDIESLHELYAKEISER